MARGPGLKMRPVQSKAPSDEYDHWLPNQNRGRTAVACLLAYFYFVLTERHVEL